MLPTPAASESGSTPEQHLARKPGRTRVTDLSVVAGHLLPTPTASESTGASGARRRDGGPSLRDVPKLLAVDVYDDELLPTPNARDFKDEALPPSLWSGEGPDKVARAVASLLPPPDGRPLFPTPTATDARDGKYLRSTTREAAARGSARGVALNHLVEGPMPEGGRPLLPTPVVRDMGAGRTAEQWDGWVGKMRDRFGGAGHGRSLEQEALRVLSTPTTGGNERSERFRGGGESRAHNPAELAADEAAAAELAAGFGPYAAAVARWEEAMGRPAPAPSAPGANGRMRLSPRFVEWMMGLPDGWVTGPDLGLSRAAQLKMLGNGVVPQQALLALRMIAAVRFTARVPR